MRNKTVAKLRFQDYLPYRLSVASNAVSQLIARSGVLVAQVERRA
jgi:hypothetical protein